MGRARSVPTIAGFRRQSAPDAPLPGLSCSCGGHRKCPARLQGTHRRTGIQDAGLDGTTPDSRSAADARTITAGVIRNCRNTVSGAAFAGCFVYFSNACQVARASGTCPCRARTIART
uniref:Uncharacterized protein n=1 Tax=Solanum lycopersicum TaxID=4081 RepID=A0A494G9E0_SOLLC